MVGWLVLGLAWRCFGAKGKRGGGKEKEEGGASKQASKSRNCSFSLFFVVISLNQNCPGGGGSSKKVGEKGTRSRIKVRNASTSSLFLRDFFFVVGPGKTSEKECKIDLLSRGKKGGCGSCGTGRRG